MDYEDKLALMATILLAARMQRGNQVTSAEVKTAVNGAMDIIDEVERRVSP